MTSLNMSLKWNSCGERVPTEQRQVGLVREHFTLRLSSSRKNYIAIGKLNTGICIVNTVVSLYSIQYCIHS